MKRADAVFLGLPSRRRHAAWARVFCYSAERETDDLYRAELRAAVWENIARALG